MSYQITSEQLEYIESFEWDSEYWDNLSTEVLDALTSEVRELCFEYYDILVAEPVRDDVKLDEVIEPVEVVPQEVVSEPQEELSTTTNEDTVMNTNTLIPNWEVSGYVSVLALDFSTATTTTPYIPEAIPDFWEDEVVVMTVNNLVKPVTQLCLPVSKVVQLYLPAGKEVVEVKPVLQPKERPLSNEERETVKFEVAQWATGKKAYVKPYKTELRPYDEIETLARIKELSTPTVTTKSGKVVKVSPHCTTPYGGSPVVSHITNPKMTSAIGEAEAKEPVVEHKDTLFNLDEYDVVKEATQALLGMFSCEEYNTLRTKYGVDVMKKAYNALDTSIKPSVLAMINQANNIRNGIELTIVATQAPKVTVAPVVSTPTPTPITHNQMMSTIRRMNGGRIPNAPVLNKLVTGYVTRNNTVISAVSKYIAPELLEMAERAYAQLTA